MPGERGPEAGDDSLARARRQHLACERFEAAWRNGEAPRIEEFLDAAESSDRHSLAAELLALEIELRRDRGETPAPADYRERFRALDLAVPIDSIFREAGSPTSRGPVNGSLSTTADERDHRNPGNGPAGSRGDSRPSGCPAEGEQVGDYQLLEEIARGGMGVVYKARQVSLNREVALKMILAGSTATPAQRERFFREAELAANLDHPNIVPIFEVRDLDGLLFFSMKLIDGGSLAHRAFWFRNDPRETARLIQVLARAVHYAHGKGFIHCDLKPSNILIDHEGQPQITDFGLARRAAEDSSLTATGAILGTPSYMAPEQASGNRRSIGAGTDVYGLGAILYELLTGRPPFRTPTMMETIVQVLERDPVPPREIRPDLPGELETICLKCLEKMPEDRYASARDLADDLERYLQGDSVEATGVFQNLRRWTRREPEVVSRLGGLSLVAVLTEFNHHFLTPRRDYLVHYGVQAILVCWALSAILFQALLRQGWRPDRVRMLWATADMVSVTLALKLLGRVESSLLVGYPLMIAASGLWFQTRLVWFTTGLSILCYLILYMDWAFHRTPLASVPPDYAIWPYPNIFVASLALTGFVVARQIKRILALSRYYEHRQAH
jgi:serine/threonine protein kinase